MQSKASTVEQYLAELPEDRRIAMSAVRKVILENLDSDYSEGMSYGMIGYCVPHRVYPAGYHCNPAQPLPYAGLASQKGHMSVYLMCVYGHPVMEKWFRDEWAKTGKRLDMGKSCVRFKKLEDLPLDLIGQTIRRVPAKTYIEHYEKALKAMPGNAKRRAEARRAAGAATSRKAAATSSSKAGSKASSKSKSTPVTNSKKKTARSVKMKSR